MNKATKGVLLSGLVLPGLGQIVLKRWGRGVCIIVAVSVCFTVMIVEAVQLVFAVMEMASGGGTVKVTNLWGLVKELSIGSEIIAINICFLLISIIWFAAVIDAYFLGRGLDMEHSSITDDEVGSEEFIESGKAQTNRKMKDEFDIPEV